MSNGINNNFVPRIKEVNLHLASKKAISNYLYKDSDTFKNHLSKLINSK